MTSSTIQQFSRARVKARMIRKAAELWGYSEAETDAFDPLVSMLLEACALEFEKIAHETANSQARAVEHLAQVMSPGVDVARPAYCIIQARGTEPRATLPPEAQFVYKKPNGNYQSGSAESAEVYFSPIRPVTVFNGAIKVIADPSALYAVENGYQKVLIGEATKETISRDKYLWLGLELDNRLDSLAGLSFFFGWQHEPDQHLYYPFLPLSKWLLGGVPLVMQAGILSPGAEATTGSDPTAQTDDLTWQLLSRFFLNISPGGASLSLRDQRRPYPPELEAVFPRTSLSTLRNPLLWLRVQFPQAMPLEALKTVYCAVNSFPVVNRKLHRLTYRLQTGINIIPLEANEPFLAVKTVQYNATRPLTYIPLPAIQHLSSQEYTLQYHVSRFDERSASEWLNYLLELVRDESMAFSALGEEFLSSVLRELNQSLSRLEQKVQQKSSSRPVIPYLVIKSATAGENVYVEYWTTHGDAANKIPATSRLLPYQHSDVQRNEVYLLTSTTGGQEKPGVNEKIRAYKRSLLTHGRVVTLADIQAVCLAELGNKARRVEVKKDFMMGTTPEVGFTRCLRVCLTPADPPATGAVDWQTVCEGLRITLETHSAIHLPILVQLSPVPSPND